MFPPVFKPAIGSYRLKEGHQTPDTVSAGAKTSPVDPGRSTHPLMRIQRVDYVFRTGCGSSSRTVTIMPTPVRRRYGRKGSRASDHEAFTGLVADQETLHLTAPSTLVRPGRDPYGRDGPRRWWAPVQYC